MSLEDFDIPPVSGVRGNISGGPVSYRAGQKRAEKKAGHRRVRHAVRQSLNSHDDRPVRRVKGTNAYDLW